MIPQPDTSHPDAFHLAWCCRCLRCGHEWQEQVTRLAFHTSRPKAERCPECDTLDWWNTGPVSRWCGEERRRYPGEWSSWRAAADRCTNPKNISWSYYGGRGISMCPEWLASFAAFIQHIGPKPSPELTLDRINNEGNYEPGNVRWATIFQQANNRRPPRRRKPAGEAAA